MNCRLENLDYYRTTQTEPLGGGSPRVDLAQAEPVASGVAPQSTSEAPDTLHEEKIALWMQSIKDFIRKIDVKAL
ncbi:MAG: hypothetical protein LLG06_18550 [Desulfobacteraceae bacterium]|nr:hypothetical protein [Desulfobacteraceae bacterium]